MMVVSDEKPRAAAWTHRMPRMRVIILSLFAAACLLPFFSTVYTHAFEGDGSAPSRRAPPYSTLSTRPTWRFENTAQYCKTLVANPVKLESCQRDRETQACPNGKVAMMSQFFQDYYLYTRHFSKLRRRGVYLDVAANDPMHLSNTYFMDECLGWDGLCVEGNPVYIHKLRAYRSCRILPTCVGETHGQNVSFVLGGGSGGITETNKNMDQWKKSNTRHEEISLTCTTMSRTLSHAGVTKVDYLSLDVEGHELPVLKGFDWNKVIINVMTVEVSKSTIDGIEEFLADKGYVRHMPDLDERAVRSGLLHTDAIFLHKTVTFGDPK